MNAKNPIVKATFIVFATIWVAMNIYTLITDPVFFWENIPNMVHGAFVTFVGCVMGVILTAGLILFERSVAQMRLQGGSFNGVTSSIGPVPILAPPAKRAKAKECLPIESERVKQWIDANKVTHPEYVTMFMAIWETLSAHKTHPASHRKGGHGGRTLAQHCMAVADTALELAPGWSYEGVYIKRPGKSPKLIIAKRNANYVFDPRDPIIPVLALAHDLGKIEAYKLQADGAVLTSETGSMQDDAGVKHDALGARILARMSEFWELPPNDTRTLSRVISHYHHPSDFPVDKDGLSIDDRMTALMEFLILADKTTGQLESGISAATANEDTISETEAEEIYTAFVACVTEQGRINGTGDKDTDKAFKIGQKHGSGIYMREEPLLAAMCRKLGVSVELGRGRLILLNRVLHVLEEKGLLSTIHGNVDFKHYLPLYLVRFYHSENASVLADWHQTIVITPTTKHTDLAALVNLQGLSTVAKIISPYFGHLSQVSDSAKLLEMVEMAFGEEVASSVQKGIADARLQKTRAGHSHTPEPERNPVLSEPSPASERLAKNSKPSITSPKVAEGLIHAHGEPVLVEAALPAHGESTPVMVNSSSLAVDQRINWDELGSEVKTNGFNTKEELGGGSDTSSVAIDDDIPDVSNTASIGKACGDPEVLDVGAPCDISAEDLDLVADMDGMTDGSLDHAEPSVILDSSNMSVEMEPSQAPDETEMLDRAANHSLGIPKTHDAGTAVQDVPKDPVSNYKKQKQAERNEENLGQLQQAGDSTQFIQNLAAAKSRKKNGDGLVAFLGAGNDPKLLQKQKSGARAAAADVTSTEASGEFRQMLSYETFQKLIQRAVDGGTLHCLATLEGKHYILQSMIESAFPGAAIEERLPASYVERRSTRAGTVLLIPVAALTND